MLHYPNMNPVLSILSENINNPNSLFVFPTDIASSRWADLLLRKMAENSDTAAVSMEKFIAWDIFKQNSIKSKVQNKKSIPSALRKIFVSRLVKENAEAAAKKTPIFTSLIRVEWAQQASQFTSWLTAILPQLGAWFNKTTSLTINDILKDDSQKAASKFEGDDKDMFTLALRYAQFLEKHSLFEPAWETPPFNEDGKEVYIFFPESLSDYSEYKDLLDKSEHVKIIRAKESKDLISNTFFYTNSRSEITEASLYIRALNEKQNIEWDSIAVCIPDAENYEPYVLREFNNRNIPYVKRSSKALSDYPAGRFFNSILECYSQDFSFTSLVSLVLNKNLPWKEIDLIDELIQFGIKNNCLYSWTEESEGKQKHINVWEDAFNNPIEFYNKEMRAFFISLKKRIISFRGAESFADLRKQYFIFREQFFNMEDCSDETDLILSRCISELINLVELEKGFPDVPAVDPFSFFTEFLADIYYLPKSDFSGVAILPYKTAAAAPFDCHIILGAGQESLSVVYSHLNFLPKKKREELGISDEDASVSFINMHKYNSIKSSAFFCCEQTFSGFAIPHSKIGSPSQPRERYASDVEYCENFIQDIYKEEINNFNTTLPGSDKEQRLHENQKKGFTEWKKRRFQNDSDVSVKDKWTTSEEVQKIINSSFAKTGKYSVSATSLQKYYQCSLKWLFESVFKLENIQIETSLMAENISGLVYHAILNKFFTELKNNNPELLEPVQLKNELVLPDSYSKLLEKSINDIFNIFPSLNNRKMSALTARLLGAGKKDFKFNLERFLSHFLSHFSGCSVAGSESYYRLERDSYIMNGSIDCILKNAQDEYIIVDFKLKYMPDRCDCTAENEENSLADFQLPMYITLTEETNQYKVYTALFYSIIDLKPEVIIGNVYNSITKKEIPAKKEDQIIRESEWYNLIFKDFKKKTEQFAEEISTGNLTVFAQKNNDCFDCDYQRICRTVYIIDKENNLLGKY